jgi:two-component system phosphate regulon sensor histidine kinase PhoR
VWNQIRRVALIAVGLSAPSLAVVLGLAVFGFVAPAVLLIATVSIPVLTAVVVAPFVIAMEKLRAAFEALEADAMTPLDEPTGFARAASASGTLWRSLRRQSRVWRERVHMAQTQRAAAEAVIAAIPDPLILIDDRRRIVRANAAAASFAGAGAAAEPRDLAAALRNPAVLAAADAVLGGDPERIVEFVVAAPVERQWRARFARIARPSLDDAAAVLSLHDITELKRAEQMRVDFIANASHELRTPLATLIGFIETLRGAAREDAEARERFLAIMHEEASRMARLVADLLSLTRIELNEHVPPTGRLALRPVLARVVDALQLRAGARNMRIRLALPNDLPEIVGDADELAQLFENLLVNAINYGRPGTEIAIGASTRTRTGEFLAVAVEDRGDGIAREHLPRLTERFYRVDTARSRQIGGTGLGLAIVKHILNRHHGLLEIDSTPGVGSVFLVLIPAAPN